eukprot:scaffold765_cov345-Prasinococcus_capsulatus_cf.AAC.10
MSPAAAEQLADRCHKLPADNATSAHVARRRTGQLSCTTCIVHISSLPEHPPGKLGSSTHSGIGSKVPQVNGLGEGATGGEVGGDGGAPTSGAAMGTGPGIGSRFIGVIGSVTSPKQLPV